MAFTQTELDTLNSAIAQGALVVKYGDKEVTYRNLKDMLQTKAIMEADINQKSPITRRYASFSKGLK